MKYNSLLSFAVYVFLISCFSSSQASSYKKASTTKKVAITFGVLIPAAVLCVYGYKKFKKQQAPDDGTLENTPFENTTPSTTRNWALKNRHKLPTNEKQPIPYQTLGESPTPPKPSNKPGLTGVNKTPKPKKEQQEISFSDFRKHLKEKTHAYIDANFNDKKPDGLNDFIKNQARYLIDGRIHCCIIENQTEYNKLMAKHYADIEAALQPYVKFVQTSIKLDQESKEAETAYLDLFEKMESPPQKEFEEAKNNFDTKFDRANHFRNWLIASSITNKQATEKLNQLMKNYNAP
ncbi:MAG: hypothetical protein OXE99_05905 [Cellvibrionales bacterium]|nr:hypothetical protein [Cellvibrionales bacterium]